MLGNAQQVSPYQQCLAALHRLTDPSTSAATAAASVFREGHVEAPLAACFAQWIVDVQRLERTTAIDSTDGGKEGLMRGPTETTTAQLSNRAVVMALLAVAGTPSQDDAEREKRRPLNDDQGGCAEEGDSPPSSLSPEPLFLSVVRTDTMAPFAIPCEHSTRVSILKRVLPWVEGYGGALATRLGLAEVIRERLGVLVGVGSFPPAAGNNPMTMLVVSGTYAAGCELLRAAGSCQALALSETYRIPPQVFDASSAQHCAEQIIQGLPVGVEPPTVPLCTTPLLPLIQALQQHRFGTSGQLASTAALCVPVPAPLQLGPLPPLLAPCGRGLSVAMAEQVLCAGPSSLLPLDPAATDDHRAHLATGYEAALRAFVSFTGTWAGRGPPSPLYGVLPVVNDTARCLGLLGLDARRLVAVAMIDAADANRGRNVAAFLAQVAEGSRRDAFVEGRGPYAAMAQEAVRGMIELCRRTQDEIRRTISTSIREVFCENERFRPVWSKARSLIGGATRGDPDPGRILRAASPCVLSLLVSLFHPLAWLACALPPPDERLLSAIPVGGAAEAAGLHARVADHLLLFAGLELVHVLGNVVVDAGPERQRVAENDILCMRLYFQNNALLSTSIRDQLISVFS